MPQSLLAGQTPRETLLLGERTEGQSASASQTENTDLESQHPSVPKAAGTFEGEHGAS